MKHPNEPDESTTRGPLSALGCSDVLEALPLFVGDDLESDRGPSIEAHLASCTSCSDEARRARDARELFRRTLDESLRVPAATGSLWSDIRKELAADGLLNGHERSRGPLEAVGRPVASEGSAAPVLQGRAGLRAVAPALAGLAAAVTLLVLWRPWSPEATLPGASPGADATQLALPAPVGGVLPVAAHAGGHAGSAGGAAGLRRVGAQDSTLFQEAKPLYSEQELPGRERSSTTLVNYR